MAATPPRVFPLPRGQLSYTLPSFYLNYLMTGSKKETGNGAGDGPQVGLYNDATDGRYLHVLSMSIWWSDATTDVLVKTVNAVLGLATSTPGVPVNPLIAPSAGVIAGGPRGSDVGTYNIWRASGGGFPEVWPYSHPIYILPPGWSLYTYTQNTSATISAAFQWLALKP